MTAPLLRKRSTLLALLTVVFILLLMAAVFTGKDDTHQDAFTELNGKSINTITVQSGSDSLKFAKNGSGWYLSEPFRRKADSSRIQILLATLTIPKGAVYTPDEINPAEVGLLPYKASLTLNTTQFLFGNKEVNGDRRYLRLNDKITLAADIVYPLIARGASGFVEANLVPAGIVAISTPAYSLDKSSGIWQSSSMDQASAEARVAQWLAIRFHDILPWPLNKSISLNDARHIDVQLQTSASNKHSYRFIQLPELVLVHPQDAAYTMVITPEQFASLQLGSL